MGAQITDQRIGDRIPVDIDGVAWLPPMRRRSFLRRSSLHTARVVEFSLSGAGVLAPAEPLVPMGQLVTMVMNGHRGTVKVRRRVATDDPAIARYGVEFVELDEAFREDVRAKFAEACPERKSLLGRDPS